MKKIFIVSILFGLFLYSSGCFLEESCTELSSAERADIKAEIEAVEDEINSGTYSGFMDLMHPDSDYYGTFTSGDYDDLDDPYTFHNYGKACDQSGDGSITLKADNASVSGMSTEFIMRLDAGNWKVLRWYEEEEPIYRNYQPPQ